MSDIDRYYDILGLRPGASPEDVRQAHRDMAKVWHPDRFLDDPRLQRLAHERMKAINQAYGGLQAHHEPVVDRRHAIHQHQHAD